MIALEVQGLDEVIELLEGTDIPRQLENIVGFVTEYSARLAASMTPVDTGAMQRAWKGKVLGMEGSVFIDPSAVNYRSGTPVTAYAGIVDEREGISLAVVDHATRMGAAMLGEIEYVNQ